MTIQIKFKFMQEVRVVHSGDSGEAMIVTDIQVKADGSYIYGCLCTNGDTKFFKEYELIEISPQEEIMGFKVNIE